MDKQNAMLREHGPTDFHAGDDIPTIPGAVAICKNPPMWIMDDCPQAMALIAAFESSDDVALEDMEHPGSAVPLKRAYIDAARVSAYTSFVGSLLGTQSRPSKVSVKRYMGAAGESSDVALEDPHIDRNRDESSERFRWPMRYTVLVSFDDHGATAFPFATLDPNATLPEHVSARACTVESDGRGWPVIEPAGVVVGGKRGRVLIFASSSPTTPSVPLYRSLHHGVLYGTQTTRTVSILGFDGVDFEISGRHECLDHETFQTRADFFDRTLEEEIQGVIDTGDKGLRYAEAVAARGAIEGRRRCLEHGGGETPSEHGGGETPRRRGGAQDGANVQKREKITAFLVIPRGLPERKAQSTQESPSLLPTLTRSRAAPTRWSRGIDSRVSGPSKATP